MLFSCYLVSIYDSKTILESKYSPSFSILSELIFFGAALELYLKLLITTNLDDLLSLCSILMAQIILIIKSNIWGFGVLGFWGFGVVDRH